MSLEVASWWPRGGAGVYLESVGPDCAEHRSFALVVGGDLGCGDVCHVFDAEHDAAPLFHHWAEDGDEGARHRGHGRIQ